MNTKKAYRPSQAQAMTEALARKQSDPNMQPMATIKTRYVVEEEDHLTLDPKGKSLGQQIDIMIERAVLAEIDSGGQVGRRFESITVDIDKQSWDEMVFRMMSHGRVTE